MQRMPRKQDSVQHSVLWAQSLVLYDMGVLNNFQIFIVILYHSSWIILLLWVIISLPEIVWLINLKTFWIQIMIQTIWFNLIWLIFIKAKNLKKIWNTNHDTNNLIWFDLIYFCWSKKFEKKFVLKKICQEIWFDLIWFIYVKAKNLKIIWNKKN